MKVLPSILLMVFTFLSVWGFMDSGIDYSSLLKTTGPLGLVAAAFGYGIDVLIFLFLARRAAGVNKVDDADGPKG